MTLRSLRLPDRSGVAPGSEARQAGRQVDVALGLRAVTQAEAHHLVGVRHELTDALPVLASVLAG